MIFKSRNDTEKSPSWSRAHDWKSCNRQKRFESSNLSFSASAKSTQKGALFALAEKESLDEILHINLLRKFMLKFESLPSPFLITQSGALFALAEKEGFELTTNIKHPRCQGIGGLLLLNKIQFVEYLSVRGDYRKNAALKALCVPVAHCNLKCDCLIYKLIKPGILISAA